MKVGFHIPRMNCLANFGPLVEYFLSKGSEVFLYCDNSLDKKKRGYKAYLYPEADLIKGLFSSAEVVVYKSESEAIESIKSCGIRVMILQAFDRIAKRIRNAGISREELLVASLQTGFDIFTNKNSFCDDVVYLFTPIWKDCWKKWLYHFGAFEPELIKDIDVKTELVGFLQMGRDLKLSREKICAEYNIPAGRKIVVYLPFPWRVPFCKWSHIFFKPQNKLFKIVRLLLRADFRSIPNVFKAVDDKQLSQTIRRFSDKNDAFLIVKGRAKNKIPSYLAKIADKVMLDESYYPSTIVELLSVADICIHFYSDVIKEAVALGVPNICLGPAEPSDWACYAPRFFLPEFSPEPGSYYNFDSVVYNESVDDFVENFDKKTFEDYNMDPAKRHAFVAKYIGCTHFDSCRKVYEDIMERLRRAKAKV